MILKQQIHGKQTAIRTGHEGPDRDWIAEKDHSQWNSRESKQPPYECNSEETGRKYTLW